ncbi:MAG: hypothetical protein KF712_16370 [Akkermansiaceae bacterium]|nr:hypothetical protein [Akkermansiaceae bacterium]
MIKKQKANDGTANAGDTQAPAYRDNAEINAKIDDHIAKNPKRWEYVRAMPRERLERAVILSDVQKAERQQKMANGVMKKLEADPELKKTYENLVSHLPENEREKAIVSIARTMGGINSRQQQAPAQGSLKV